MNLSERLSCIKHINKYKAIVFSYQINIRDQSAILDLTTGVFMTVWRDTMDPLQRSGLALVPMVQIVI